MTVLSKMDPNWTPDEEPCPECGDGDGVPASGYWICPTCDAEWNDEDEA